MKLPRRIRRRLAQAAGAWFPPAGRLHSQWERPFDEAKNGDSWSRYFTGDRDHPWLWSDEDLRRITDWVRSRKPEWVDACRARADRVVARRFSFLGQGELQCADPIDWALDPISGRHWPMVRAERVPIDFNDRRSDIKYVWEIARFSFAPSLATAFALTRDRCYSAAFRGLVDDFIESNPYKRGPHWTNPMEAAVRAVNWIVAWQLCRESGDFDDAFVRRFAGSLLTHARFISRNLECDRRGTNTNHYIADLVGLYVVATFLPEWPESGQWRRLALSELLEESQHQILPDGFCYESSFGYHRLCFEMWFFFWRLAAQQGESGVTVLAEPLRRMAELSRSCADASGRLPEFGDGDDGRFVFWQPREPSDHRLLWQLTDRALGTRRRTRQGDGEGDCEDAVWLLGVPEDREKDSVAVSQTEPASGSRLFEDAQIAVLRSRRWLVHVYANPVGTGGIGGHKHNDLLSFTAACDGVPVVIDPGTCVYTTDPKARVAMRRTDAHATVVIDDAEQNRFAPGQLFFLWQDSKPTVTCFETQASHDRIVMQHDGYARLGCPVIHQRELILDHEEEAIRITDRLSGNGVHRVQAVFPLGAMNAKLTGKHEVILFSGDRQLIRLSLNSESNFRLSIVHAWRSRAYGQREAHRRLVFTARISAPAEWTTIISAIPHDQAEENRHIASPEFSPQHGVAGAMAMTAQG